MIIDTQNLNNLRLCELAALLLLYDDTTDASRNVVEVKETDIASLYKSLQKKGYISSSIYTTDHSYEPPYTRQAYILLEKGKQVLAENCLQGKKAQKKFADAKLKQRCDSLAVELSALYPLGKKPGTNLTWRGSVKTVSEKLQQVILEGNDFTDEEAVTATKEYVSGFNGIYTKMRILPYFIKKNIVVGGEVEKTRDFMSYVEDLRNNSKRVSQNWDVELK